MTVKRKTNTHVVVKTEDIHKYLTVSEVMIMELLLRQVHRGRLGDKKPVNDYLVVNEDEPYAKDVLALILEGEEAKEVNK